MTSDATQCFGADVAFADVPVTIDARVVDSARIVEVNGAHVLSLHCLLHSLKQRFESVFFTNVVSGRERVCSVETDGERKLRANAHDRFQMFETMTDAVALSGSVLQKDLQLSKPQALARDLQTRRAQRDAVSFTSAARTSRMDHEIINAEQQRSLNFFTKRSARFLQHHVIRSSEVDEVVAVNQHRRDLCLLARLAKQL